MREKRAGRIRLSGRLAVCVRDYVFYLGGLWTHAIPTVATLIRTIFVKQIFLSQLEGPRSTLHDTVNGGRHSFDDLILASGWWVGEFGRIARQPNSFRAD